MQCVRYILNAIYATSVYIDSRKSIQYIFVQCTMLIKNDKTS